MQNVGEMSREQWTSFNESICITFGQYPFVDDSIYSHLMFASVNVMQGKIRWGSLLIVKFSSALTFIYLFVVSLWFIWSQNEYFFVQFMIISLRFLQSLVLEQIQQP